MRTFKHQSKLWLPIPRAELFPFFADARNLVKAFILSVMAPSSGTPSPSGTGTGKGTGTGLRPP